VTARYYGLRRVNPFLGTLQVVEMPEARGLSPNGSRWQIELLSQAAVRQPLWADIGPASAERRFFTYGVWSRQTGMRRLPVNPMLGDQSSHPGLGPLLEALDNMPALPFPAVDHLELWLLDRGDRPLALVAAMKGEAPPSLPYPPAWRPVPAGEGPVPRPGDEPEPPAFDGVERLVSAEAGSPAKAQWFRRLEDGSGTGLEGFRLGAGLEGRELPREDFPELLVREAWPLPAERALVATLVAWQAPLLLTLAGLTATTRARLEPLAARRTLALYRQRRLIPEVIDRRLIDAALVEAVIRSTA
jgi:hypothetical protein